MPRLHLDTDIDYLCALAMVLAWPGAELVGVTTNSDDRGRRAGYARYALRLAGREDVAVASGADVSLGCYRVRPGLPDEARYWPEAVPPVRTPIDEALSLLRRSVEGGATIVALGPCTNLALLEKRHPGALKGARIVLMGGFVFPPREGFPAWTGDMDWNLQVEAPSALLVIEQSNPTLVPVSVTLETALRRAHLPGLQRSGALARLIARQAEAFARDEGFEALYGRSRKGLPADIINFLHDPLACAVALHWDRSVQTRELPLRTEIRDGWLRQSVDGGGKLTRVVTGVDGTLFSELWLSTVCGISRPP